MNDVFIIAEAGVNHNGDVDQAKIMIEAAAKIGADAIKFQTFQSEKIVSAAAPKADYQKQTTDEHESQLAMLKKLELPYSVHQELFDHCQKFSIQFMSTPFDLESVDVLVNLGVEKIKISSGEITNLPLLRKIGSLGKEIIISTGMANMDEVKTAVNVLTEAGTPKNKIVVLHCNTQYPTPIQDVNLRALVTLQDDLNIRVGYSDHTMGSEVAIGAVAMGAEVIEKHFTLDSNQSGPDHAASLEPKEFESMIQSIRNIEKALGSGVKEPTHSEMNNRVLVRKSIVASCTIKKGDVITEEHITTKRPAVGLSPMSWDDVLGKNAIKDFNRDEVIEL